MTDITVPVPDDRTAEFYQFFGLWLAGSLNPSEVSQGHLEPLSAAAESVDIKPWTGSEDDLEDAEWLWEKFSRQARGMFSLLADDPGAEYPADQIAETVGIRYGRRGVAGTLAWPGRYGLEVGRGVPVKWREDVDAGKAYYWMTPEVASTFRAARERAEGAA